MTCKQLIEFLSEYLAGGLSADERARFESHLSMCSACRRYLSQFKTAMDLTNQLKSDPAPQLPPDLVKAIVDAAKK